MNVRYKFDNWLIVSKKDKSKKAFLKSAHHAIKISFCWVSVLPAVKIIDIGISAVRLLLLSRFQKEAFADNAIEMLNAVLPTF